MTPLLQYKITGEVNCDGSGHTYADDVEYQGEDNSKSTTCIYNFRCTTVSDSVDMHLLTQDIESVYQPGHHIYCVPWIRNHALTIA